MSPISGIEVCQVVRNDPYWKSLSVLFIVDNLKAEIVQQLFAVGADACISKSTENSLLAIRILNLLKRT